MLNNIFRIQNLENAMQVHEPIHKMEDLLFHLRNIKMSKIIVYEAVYAQLAKTLQNYETILWK